MGRTHGVETFAARCRLAGRVSFILLVMSCSIMVSETFAVSVSPNTLRYSATSSSPMPASQTLTFNKNSIVSKNWTVTGNASWISVSPSSGTIAREKDQVSVSVNASGLAAGTYSGVVNINVGGQLTTVPISLTVAGGTVTPTPTPTPTSTTPTPSLQISPVSLNFSGTAGGVAPLAQTFNLSNPSGGTLTWTLTEPAAWLGLNIASGTTTTEVDAISANVSITGLAAGTYNTAITVSASGATNSPQIIPVTLTLSAPATTGTAALSWDPSTDTTSTKYNVYMGTQPGVYGAPVSVGLATNYMVSNLTSGKTYYFSVTVVNSAGSESPHSNEVYKVVQ